MTKTVGPLPDRIARALNELDAHESTTLILRDHPLQEVQITRAGLVLPEGVSLTPDERKAFSTLDLDLANRADDRRRHKES
jgi:hypothetical protein